MTLVQHLGILESAGLLRLAAAQPELEYAFRHALIQNAAYNTLVKADRVQLHRAVGETLERLHAERRDEFAPVLARHFAEAGDNHRALEYFTLAGDVAARAYANTEATEHYARAIAIARRITAEGQFKPLYLKRGRALQSSGRYPETWANYVEMEYGFSGRLAQALALADEAYQISVPSNNVTQQVFSRLIAGQVYTYLGQPDRALENLERARSLGSPFGTGPIDATLALLYGSFGAIERALASARQSYDVTQSTPLFRVFGVSVVGTLAWLHALKGELAEAEPMFAEAHRLTDGIGVVAWLGGAQLPLAKGELALARRDYPRVVVSMQRTAATLRAQGVRVHVPEALHLAARALLALDRLQEAHAILCEARAEAEAMGTRRILWQILIALSQAEEQGGNSAEAESLRQQAREVIGTIADHCPPDLRASFLDLPDVKDAILA